MVSLKGFSCFLDLSQIILLFLKFTGIVDWSWGWILSPFIVAALLAFVSISEEDQEQK